MRWKARVVAMSEYRALKRTTYHAPQHDKLQRIVNCQELLDFLLALRDKEGINLSTANYDVQGGGVLVVSEQVIL